MALKRSEQHNTNVVIRTPGPHCYPTLPPATDFFSAKTGVRFTLHKDNEKEKDRNAGQIIRADMPGREAQVVFIKQQLGEEK